MKKTILIIIITGMFLLAGCQKETVEDKAERLQKEKDQREKEYQFEQEYYHPKGCYNISDYDRVEKHPFPEKIIFDGKIIKFNNLSPNDYFTMGEQIMNKTNGNAFIRIYTEETDYRFGTIKGTVLVEESLKEYTRCSNETINQLKEINATQILIEEACIDVPPIGAVRIYSNFKDNKHNLTICYDEE